MIVLPIDQSSIDNPRRIDVGRIGEVMLWPCDEETRAKAMLVEQCLWERSLLDQGQLLPPAVEALAKASIDAPAAADMAKANANVFVNGYVAGLILHIAVSAAEEHPKEAAIQATVRRISESFGPEWRLRPQTINNHIWPHYRTVAHLWAAFVFSDNHVFPCRHQDLGTFLARAEAYRELGENTRTRHSRSAVLRPGESAKLPAGLRLPAVKLRFEPQW